jgi:hypothetical protein
MKCPKCGARIRHHPGKEIELLSPGAPPAPATPGAAPSSPPAEEKKGSTVAVAIVPELVGKLVSQSESKQNIVVVWGAVAVVALAVSIVGFLMRDLILGVAPIAVALVAAFVWLSIRAKNRAERKDVKPAAKDEGKTEALPKV